MIDINKPMELAGGKPVEFKAMCGEYITVWLYDKTRYFSKTGEHKYNRLPNLRNTQEEIPAHIKAYIDERIASLSEPAVDPDVAAVREIIRAYEHETNQVARNKAALSAYKRHKHG